MAVILDDSDTDTGAQTGIDINVMGGSFAYCKCGGSATRSD